ncbi:HAD family hydrolase [Mariniblastus sp.]|nr:HAD family hydrolase [Mariniblastus sp.]
MRKFAIIFDMDDTLFAESTFVFSGFEAVAIWGKEKLSLPKEQSLECLNNLFNSGERQKTFDLWLEEFGVETSDHIITETVEIYRNHRPNIKPFSWVSPLLSEIRYVYGVGLLSDGFLKVQTQKFNALKIAPLFDAVLFSDELGRNNWKPSSKPYKKIAKDLNLKCKNCIYIGDNPTKDFIGARRAGMLSIRYRYHGGIYHDLEPATAEHRPDLELSEISELENAIQELFY